MDHAGEENLFTIENFGLSWSDVRKHTANLINRCPEKYRLAYFNDYHEKLIMLMNEEHNFFGIQDPQILVISKIDNSKNQSLLAFEVKGFRGDISSQEEYTKATASLKRVSGYLKMFATPVNN
jgi:hypothetical protein